MKKFSIARLEQARRSPIDFAQSLLSPISGGTPRFSKYMAWQLAVFQVFKGKDLNLAIEYFEKTFKRNFKESTKNLREMEEFILMLHGLHDEYIKQKLTFIENKKRIEIQLSTKVKITGEIPLIFMNQNLGYSVYFFSKDSQDWETELRFPIIQNFVANTLYGVDLSDVEVGVFGVDYQKFMSISFSEDTIKDALSELKSIGKSISSIL